MTDVNKDIVTDILEKDFGVLDTSRGPLAINKRSGLMIVANHLGVSADWSNTSDQRVECKPRGESLDNTGQWGSGTQCIPEDVEQYLTIYQNNKPVAEVNLASLLSWAAVPVPPTEEKPVSTGQHLVKYLEEIDFFPKLQKEFSDSNYTTIPIDELTVLVQFEHTEKPADKFVLCQVIMDKKKSRSAWQGSDILCYSMGSSVTISMDSAETMAEKVKDRLKESFGSKMVKEIYEIAYKNWPHFTQAKDIFLEILENKPSVDYRNIFHTLGLEVDDILHDHLMETDTLKYIDDSDLIAASEEDLDLDGETLEEIILEESSPDGDDLLRLAKAFSVTLTEEEEMLLVQYTG